MLIKSKRYLKIGLIASSLILLSACGSRAYVMQWNASNGSRADGTVRLVAETRTGIRYAPGTAQADSLAEKRCKAWGYHGAEAFGASTRTCLSSNAKQCIIWENSRVYQCTGTGNGNNPNNQSFTPAQSAQPVVINIQNQQQPNPPYPQYPQQNNQYNQQYSQPYYDAPINQNQYQNNRNNRNTGRSLQPLNY